MGVARHLALAAAAAAAAAGLLPAAAASFVLRPHAHALRQRSIDLEAVIDPTQTLGAAFTRTTLLPTPTATAPPHYLFTWGDSYSSNGFDINRERPSQNDPQGLPDEVGITTTGPGEPNWIEIVTADGPLNTLDYDFAHGGAAVDNRLTDGANEYVPDFVKQSLTFLTNLATTPHPAWADWHARNSEFIIWFGRNDVYWQVVQNVSASPRLDNVIETYFHIVDAFYNVGGRRFLLLGIPPMWREPIWSILPSIYKPRVEPSTKYWTATFTRALDTWRAAHPDANVTYVDPQPVFLAYLDHPQSVGAPNDFCSNDNNTYPGNGTNCLWADAVHPAEGISAALGKSVAHLLSTQRFYSDSPGYVAGDADDFTSHPDSPTSGTSWFHDLGANAMRPVTSFILALWSSPKGGAWW